MRSASLSAFVLLACVLCHYAIPALTSVGKGEDEIAQKTLWKTVQGNFLQLVDWLQDVDHMHRRFEWNLVNIVALALACTCALLANSAGIGGGPFYMPLLTTVLGFNIKSATALSHTIVATSAVASTFYGLFQASPVDPNAPLIDLAIALMFIPSVLIGVGLGVLGNVIVPEWFQTLGLVLLLLFVVKRTSGKAVRTWQQETTLREKEIEEAGCSTDEEDNAASAQNGPEASGACFDRLLAFGFICPRVTFLNLRKKIVK